MSNHIDKLLLGAFFSTSILGVYNVAIKTQATARGVSGSMVNTVLPTLSAASYLRGESERIVIRVGWKISVISGWFFLCVFTLGQEFLNIWVGDDIGSNAGPVLQVLVVGLILQVPSALLGNYIYSIARPRWITVNNIFTSVLIIILSVLLIKPYGMIGVAFAGVLGIVLSRFPFHYWLYKKQFKSFDKENKFIHSFYGIMVSIFISGVFSVITHNYLLSTFGQIGTAMTFLISPVLIIIIILASEYLIFKNKNNILLLLDSISSKVKEWLS